MRTLSRRTFLQTSAAVLAAASVPALASPPPDKPLKWLLYDAEQIIAEIYATEKNPLATWNYAVAPRVSNSGTEYLQPNVFFPDMDIRLAAMGYEDFQSYCRYYGTGHSGPFRIVLPIEGTITWIHGVRWMTCTPTSIQISCQEVIDAESCKKKAIAPKFNRIILPRYAPGVVPTDFPSLRG